MKFPQFVFDALMTIAFVACLAFLCSCAKKTSVDLDFDYEETDNIVTTK
jgi:hypothetical protein